MPNANELGWRSLFGAWYVQDTIRLRRNLTLSLGLRHEFTTGWNEVSGRASNYVTDSSGVLVTPPIIGNSAFTQNNATKLFSPRVGLAWDVFGNGKTSVRAGFGTYYSLIDDLSFLLNSLPPANTSISCPGALLPLLPVTHHLGIPGDVLQRRSAGRPAGRKNAYRRGVEFPRGTAIEWQHRASRRLRRFARLPRPDQRRSQQHSCADLPDAQPALAGGTTAPQRDRCHRDSQYIPVPAARPNPNLGAGFFWYTEGNTSYNALQVDLNKRLSQGLPVSRQLHLVEEPRYELRAHHRAGRTTSRR